MHPDPASPFAPPAAPARAAPPVASEAEVQQALSHAHALAFLLGVTGVVHAAQVAQLLLFVSQSRVEVVVAEVLFGCHALAVWAVTPRVSDGSARATLVAAVLGAGGALSAGGWWLWLFLHGALSLLPLGIVSMSAACALACLVFLRHANRIEAARSLDP